MKMVLRFSYLLSFLIFPAIITAQTSANDSKAEAVDRIFEEMPIEARLEETPQKIYSLLSQNPFGLPQSQNERLLDLYSEHFLSDGLLNYTRETFQKKYDPEPVDEILKWFQAENIQSVLKAKKEFYTLQGIRKRVVNQYELEQNPPTENRIELIEQLSETMSAVETEVEARVIIFRAAISAFSELNGQQALSPAQIEGTVDNYRYQIQLQIGREVKNQLLTLYHGLDDEKLRKQIDFYKTDPGRWLNNTIAESVHSAYQTAADGFLDSVQSL